MNRDINYWEKDLVCVDIRDYQGFVYKIVDNETGRYYIGQKSFWRKIRRKPLKGKKRIRVDRVESDWRTYTGSSKELNELIVEKGIDKFSFYILKLCKSKSELSYEELRYQMEYDVLRDPLSFNGIINVRLSKIK